MVKERVIACQMTNVCLATFVELQMIVHQGLAMGSDVVRLFVFLVMLMQSVVPMLESLAMKVGVDVQAMTNVLKD